MISYIVNVFAVGALKTLKENDKAISEIARDAGNNVCAGAVGRMNPLNLLGGLIRRGKKDDEKQHAGAMLESPCRDVGMHLPGTSVSPRSAERIRTEEKGIQVG